MVDPEYMRLYRRYVKALRAYEILLKKRSNLGQALFLTPLPLHE